MTAGFPVYPVAPATKRPALAELGEGHANAALDLDVARAWWGSGGPYANCGVGVIAHRAGAVAIDPDSPEALAAVEALASQGGGWPEGPRVDSPRGYKRFFAAPEQLKNGTLQLRGSWNKWEPIGGADLLAGPVVVWMPDGSRTWQAPPSKALPPAPLFLVDAIEARAKAENARRLEEERRGRENAERLAELRANGDTASLDREERRGRSYAQAAVDGMASDIARMSRESGRAGALFNAGLRARTLSNAGWIDRSTAMAALDDAAHASGLVVEDGERRALAHARSGWRAGAARVATLPATRDVSGVVTRAEPSIEQVVATWLDEWRAYPFKGRSADRELVIIRAIAGKMIQHRSTSVAMSIRDIAEATGLQKGSAWNGTKRLVHGRRLPGRRAIRPSLLGKDLDARISIGSAKVRICTWTVPDRIIEKAKERMGQDLDCKLDVTPAGCDAARGLGSARAVYDALRAAPAWLTVAELARSTDVPWKASAIANHLVKLEGHGLAEREVLQTGKRGRPTYRWRLVDAARDLDAVAEELGSVGEAEQQAQQHAEERAKFLEDIETGAVTIDADGAPREAGHDLLDGERRPEPGHVELRPGHRAWGSAVAEAKLDPLVAAAMALGGGGVISRIDLPHREVEALIVPEIPQWIHDQNAADWEELERIEATG